MNLTEQSPLNPFISRVQDELASLGYKWFTWRDIDWDWDAMHEMYLTGRQGEMRRYIRVTAPMLDLPKSVAWHDEIARALRETKEMVAANVYNNAFNLVGKI